jgi:nucleotide-binding universal stress UspA family protein
MALLRQDLAPEAGFKTTAVSRKDLMVMSGNSTDYAPRIVVGVDGSRSSRLALRWAVRQAGLTGGIVDAVMAYQVPAGVSGYAWGPGPVGVDDTAEREADARKALDAMLSEEIKPDDSHRVIARVIYGHPAEVLLNAAAGADLLVVGSRGHGAFAEALLGSVSQHCAHHAQSPVLIIRGGKPGRVTLPSAPNTAMALA